MSSIEVVYGRQVLDSRGNPTVEVDVVDIVVKMPVTNEIAGIFFVEHIIGHVGKPHALVFTFFKGGIIICHARGIRRH